MTDTPPFDPPYITRYETAEGVRLVETLADGTTRAATPTSASDLQARARQPSVTATNRGSVKIPSANKPAPNPNPSPNPPAGNRRAILFLDVPFSQKDDAKSLGAKWDATTRKWYVPNGIDVNLFSRWWPEALKQEANALGKR